MEYGVQTHNKFAFLDDDVDVSDPEETLAKKVEEAKKANVTSAAPTAKKVTIQPSAVKPQAQKENEKPRAAGGDDRKRMGTGEVGGHGVSDKGRGSGGRMRGGDRFERGNREQRGGGQRPHFNRRLNVEGDDKPRQDRDNQTREDGEDKQGNRRFNGTRRGQFRGGGGRGGSRGGGNFRNGDGQRRPRSSELENKETEVKSKENENNTWGGETEAQWGDEPVAEPPPANENTEDPNATEEVKLEVETEQPPREKTYEEWKIEQQQKKEAEQIHFNTRKAGEGGDQKIYQKLIPIKKPDKKTNQLEDDVDESAQHKEKREKPLVIDVSFVDKRIGGGFGGGGDRFGGNRGERSYGGGDRGSRGRGGGGYRGNYGGGESRGGAGPSRRHQTGGGGFTLENEQFPALGAAH